MNVRSCDQGEALFGLIKDGVACGDSLPERLGSLVLLGREWSPSLFSHCWKELGENAVWSEITARTKNGYKSFKKKRVFVVEEAEVGWEIWLSLSDNHNLGFYPQAPYNTVVQICDISTQNEDRRIRSSRLSLTIKTFKPSSWHLKLCP